MAYKFQLGAATMSGSLKQEGTVDIEDSGELKIAGTKVIDASRNITAVALSASNTLRADGVTTLNGTVKLAGVGDETLAVASDSLYFLDADGFMKRDSWADIVGNAAGAGLNGSSGQFVVRVTGSIVKDTGKVGISGSIAGNGLAYAGGVNSISGLSVNVDNSSIEVNSDSLRVKAAGVTDAMLNDDVATGLAGSGLAASSGVLAVGAGSLIDVAADAIAVDLTEAAAATLADGDQLIFLDGGATGAASKGSTRDLASLFAGGDGLAASNSQLDVQVSGAVHIASDKVSISGSIAGNGLGYAGGVDSIASLAVQVDDSSIELSSDALRVKALGVTNAMLAGSIADSKLNQITTSDKVAGSAVELAATTAFEDSTGLRLKAATAGVGLTMASQVLALDFNELTAMGGTLDPTADGLTMLDGTVSKKITVANFASSIAGGGLSVSGGKLTVQSNAVNSCGDQNEDLEEGMNFGSATFTADRTWTLPGSPTVGDVVHVKAPGNLGGNDLTIQRSGSSHLIDGQTSIELESNGAAVSLMYAAANNWVIF
jgi:hypothetical protein